MLEKETSESIDFINYESMNWSKKRQDEHWNKVWVSQESLIKLLNYDLDKCRDVNLINYIGGLLEELKGEKE